MWAAAGDASFQESWLQFSSGGLAIGCDSSNIKCKHWKAGNNAIQLLVDKAKYKELEELRRSSLCARGAVSFTFVREPLSHFLSGFTEYAFRAWKGLTEIDTTFAKATLMTILGGRKPNVTGGSALRHVYPMSGVLSAGWRFDWVGVLEHADSAWEELANFSRSELVQNTKLDSSLGAHPTSSDPQGARAAMVAVLRREPELRGRLCAVCCLPTSPASATTYRHAATATPSHRPFATAPDKRCLFRLDGGFQGARAGWGAECMEI